MFDYPRYDNNDNDDTTAPYSLCQVQIDRRCTPRQRWQQCVKFGRWIATDESRVAGWYHSACTYSSNAKPIQMGATLHSIAVTRGKPIFYKLYARTYGGASDDNIQGWHEHTAKEPKFCNL